LLGVFAGVSVLAGEYRTFTDVKGRKIQAKIIKVDSRAGKLTLERDNRKKATVPVNVFSESDQIYIHEWMASQDFMSNVKFRIQIKRLKGKSDRGRGRGGDYRLEAKDSISYELKFENKTAQNFKGLRLVVWTYKSSVCTKYKLGFFLILSWLLMRAL
jgi:hypothetical protein